MARLAIIGTAGRKDDRARLTESHYNRMLEGAIKLIENISNGNNDGVSLYSGGAAWSDHIAVSLVLLGIVNPSNLTIFLPTTLTEKGFVGDETSDSMINKTAGTANYYHKLFNDKTNIDGIAELNRVKQLGAILDNSAIMKGFHARNALVAKSVSFEDGNILAFTFGNSLTDQQDWTIRKFDKFIKANEAGLKDGGTAHCWDLAMCSKYHGKLGSV